MRIPLITCEKYRFGVYTPSILPQEWISPHRSIDVVNQLTDVIQLVSTSVISRAKNAPVAKHEPIIACVIAVLASHFRKTRLTFAIEIDTLLFRLPNEASWICNYIYEIYLTNSNVQRRFFSEFEVEKVSFLPFALFEFYISWCNEVLNKNFIRDVLEISRGIRLNP